MRHVAGHMTVVPCILSIVVVLLAISHSGDAIIGINWGRQNAQRLVPSQVVDLILQNGVKYARVYSIEKDILEAFSNSGINLTISLLEHNAFSSMKDAQSWINIIGSYFDTSNIRAVFFNGLHEDWNMQAAMNTFKILQNALKKAGLGYVKASFLLNPAVLTYPILKPSQCEFKPLVMGFMPELLQLHRANNAPVVFEFAPIKDNAYDINFLYPDNKSSTVVEDHINGVKYRYYNSFDLVYDCFVSAINKLNFSDLKITVGMVGWPTENIAGSNSPAAAERYFKHLLPHVVSNTGTPLRPGAPIDIYVYALTDEKMNMDVRIRHWGIYRSNGEPKFKIDLTGQGRDIFPPTMKGIMKMPQRWCVYNSDQWNPELAKHNVNWACNHVDCSTLVNGSSCGDLSFEQNVSYVFNSYFQFRFQDEKACDFDGLGKVVVQDPSTESCFFPVEVVKGEQKQYLKPDNATMENQKVFGPTIFLLVLPSLLLIWILILIDFMISTEQLMRWF